MTIQQKINQYKKDKTTIKAILVRVYEYSFRHTSTNQVTTYRSLVTFDEFIKNAPKAIQLGLYWEHINSVRKEIVV